MDENGQQNNGQKMDVNGRPKKSTQVESPYFLALSISVHRLSIFVHFSPLSIGAIFKKKKREEEEERKIGHGSYFTSEIPAVKR